VIIALADWPSPPSLRILSSAFSGSDASAAWPAGRPAVWHLPDARLPAARPRARRTQVSPCWARIYDRGSDLGFLVAAW